MATHTNAGTRGILAALLIGGLMLVAFVGQASGAPTGASILSNSSTTATTGNPASRADDRGTITTINLNALQQNQNWKAYVGNVSGRLSLDSADGFTIYDWELTGAIGGEVYVSRFANPTFTNVSCANANNITAQHVIYNMTHTQKDSINNTFNDTIHDSFFVGSLSIGANSCPSTATFVNDSRQIMNGAQFFQEVVLQDISSQIIFVTIIDDGAYSYNNNISINNSYDFQMIVPENDVNSTPTTYYFWTELDG